MALKELSAKAVFNFINNAMLAKMHSPKNMPLEKLKPLFITIYTNLFCNFNCSYCGKSDSYDQLDTEGMFKLLRIIRKECSLVYFSGGEPLLRKDIKDIIKEAKRLKFSSISINTNMSQMHQNMEILDDITNLVASYDMEGDDGKYAKILGTSVETLATVRRNIIECAKLQKEKKFKMTINCVVIPETIPYVPNVIDFCFQNNIRFAVVPANLQSGYDNTELINNAEFQKLVDYILELKKKNPLIFSGSYYLQSMRNFEPFHCMPTLAPYILPTGDLMLPCEPLRYEKINLLEIGDYQKAMKIGFERMKGKPHCSNKCHKASRVEPVMVTQHPMSLFKMIK